MVKNINFSEGPIMNKAGIISDGQTELVEASQWLLICRFYTISKIIFLMHYNACVHIAYKSLNNIYEKSAFKKWNSLQWSKFLVLLSKDKTSSRGFLEYLSYLQDRHRNEKISST